MNLLFVNYLCFFMQKQRNLFVLAAKQGGTRDRSEVNPQSWTQHLLFICEEEH